MDFKAIPKNSKYFITSSKPPTSTNKKLALSKNRKRGSHLGAEERGVLQHLKRLGYLNRAVARASRRTVQ